MKRMAELLRLLRQARGWFDWHPDRNDAVSVEADPAAVQRWMRHTDAALLDEAETLEGQNASR